MIVTGKVAPDSHGELSSWLAFRVTFPVAKSRETTAISPASTAMLRPAPLTVQVVESNADCACAIAGDAASGCTSFDCGLAAWPHALSTRPRPSNSSSERLGCAAERSREACPTSKRLL